MTGMKWNDSIFQGWLQEDGVGRIELDGDHYRAYRFQSDDFGGAFIHRGLYSSLQDAKDACEQ